MTSPKRSMLQVDVKDLPSKPSLPVLSHLGLASVTAGALLITYALINGLSASINDIPAGAPELTQPEIPGHLPQTQSLDTLDTEPAALAAFGPPRALPSASPPEMPAHDDRPAQTDAAPETSGDSPPAVDYPWVTATVKSRDTLSRIFKRHGVRVKDAYAAANLKDAALLRKIRPGAEIRLAADDSGALAALRYHRDVFTTLHVLRENGRLRAEMITRTPEIRVRGGKATIRNNLLDAAKGVGIDLEIVYDLAQLFGWQVDFSREIRNGDQFSVLFEEQYLDGRKVGNGDILAAELLTSNRRLRAIRHVDEHGRSVYYAPNGDGIESSFLRSPLQFSRVTSHFTHRRFHPIFKEWRAHRGVDYGAPRGTPVRSTGDGVVTLVRHKHGYGKTVMIRHGEKYTTLYAHLHRFAKGMKSGRRVLQGAVIGYVGSTGWATGPHLHYEFRVNGVHRNPLTVKLPQSAPIPREHLAEFVARADGWSARLARIGAVDVAANVAASAPRTGAAEIDVAQSPAQPLAQPR